MEDYANLILLGVVVTVILVVGIVLRVMGIRYKALPGEKGGKGKKGANGKGKRGAIAEARKGAKGKGKRSALDKDGNKTYDENGDEIFFEADAYDGLDDGEGGVYEDYDMYTLKNDKRKGGFFKDGSKDKKEDKLESWDDYD